MKNEKEWADVRRSLLKVVEDIDAGCVTGFLLATTRKGESGHQMSLFVTDSNALDRMGLAVVMATCQIAKCVDRVERSEVVQ